MVAKMKEWYAPREIIFTRATTLWLIQNLGSLRTGYWPPEASNYIDIPGGNHSKKAPFTTPIEYAAEIESRLEKCGIDGLILEAIECWGKSESSMANYFKRPLWSIMKSYKLALRYVSSGPARRWLNSRKRIAVSYKEFKATRGKK